MPLRARIYWTLVTCVGCALAFQSLAHWSQHQPPFWKFAIFLAGAAVTASLKIRLPGVQGSVSTGSIFMLLALADLDLGSAMLVAALSATVQTFMRTTSRPRIEQIIFNFFANIIPCYLAGAVIHWRILARLDETGCVAVLAASVVMFLVNTWLVAGILATTSRGNVIRVWRTSFLWNYSHELVCASIAAGVHLAQRYVGWQVLLLCVPPVYMVFRSFKLNANTLEEKQKHAAEMAKLHWRTIEALALAIDAKDDTTAAHLRRVHVYAMELAKELKLSDLEKQALDAAALLHDIGKLAVPEHIISKPGRLTPDEFDKMKIHPVVGAEILARVEFPYPVVPIVRSHHEKWDGTGYPDGIQGDAIPIGARILSVVDCLDALASDRQYRRAMPLDQAMNVVAAESGRSFDPAVVAILQRRYKELEVLAKTATETGPSLQVAENAGGAPAAGFVTESLASQGGGRWTSPSQIASARRDFQELVKSIGEMGESVSTAEALALAAVRISSLVNADALVIYGCEADAVAPKFVSGESQRLFASLRIPIGQGLSGWVAETRRPILNGNPAVEAGYLNDPRKITSLRSALSVPLFVGEKLVGVLTVCSLQADAFNTDDQRLLLTVGDEVAKLLQGRPRASAEAAGDVRVDAATGLPNARALFEHLESSIGVATDGVSVMLIELVGFKLANDLFGHRAGDQLIRAFAEELRALCSGRDFLARLGGDEFAIVFAYPDPELGAAVAARLQSIAAETSLAVCGRSFLSAVSGTANYPADGKDVDVLLRAAEAQISQARRARTEAQPERRSYLIPAGTLPLPR